MTDTAPLHPDDGIARPFRFAWYVACGVDCVAFDIRAWRDIELARFRAEKGRGADSRAQHRTRKAKSA
jgi:hypothetical protein